MEIGRKYIRGRFTFVALLGVAMFVLCMPFKSVAQDQADEGSLVEAEVIDEGNAEESQPQEIEVIESSEQEVEADMEEEAELESGQSDSEDMTDEDNPQEDEVSEEVDKKPDQNKLKKVKKKGASKKNKDKKIGKKIGRGKRGVSYDVPEDSRDPFVSMLDSYVPKKKLGGPPKKVTARIEGVIYDDSGDSVVIIEGTGYSEGDTIQGGKFAIGKVYKESVVFIDDEDNEVEVWLEKNELIREMIKKKTLKARAEAAAKLRASENSANKVLEVAS